MSEIIAETPFTTYFPNVLMDNDIPRPEKETVAIIGSGNWGSAISMLISQNVNKYKVFNKEVKMWVFEEQIGDRKLTDIINTEHENVKYLPGHKLGENIIAVPDVVDVVKDATILVFVVPHQFLRRLLKQIKPHLRPDVFAVSLIKGLDHDNQGHLEMITDIISRELNIDCSILSGANVANGVANGEFAEATIGYSNREHAELIQVLFHTDNFCTELVNDPVGVEFCGALKNIIALGAGFIDALGEGSNTKAALIRIGLMEMKKFAKMFYHGARSATFFQSSGVADLITTCYGGRNVRCAEAFVKTKKSWSEIENEMLNGQKLQGTSTCKQVYDVLVAYQMETEFPLFSMIYNISFRGYEPSLIIEACRQHYSHLTSKYSYMKEEGY
ncbi:hypothetical protein WA158_001232 [Blastocystis sp. Blastoise]